MPESRPVSRLDDQTGVHPLNSACNLALRSTRLWTMFKFRSCPSLDWSQTHIHIEMSSALCACSGSTSPNAVCLATGNFTLLPELGWKSYQIGSILLPGGRELCLIIGRHWKFRLLMTPNGIRVTQGDGVKPHFDGLVSPAQVNRKKYVLISLLTPARGLCPLNGQNEEVICHE